MENEETTIDKNLKAAFNNGYLLGKHKQEIADVIQSSYPQDGNTEQLDLLKMFIKGIEQATQEIEQNLQAEQDLESIKKTREGEQEKDLAPDI